MSGVLWAFSGIIVGFALAEFLDRDLHR